MSQQTIKAERAAELLYELFKAKQWLVKSTVMLAEDAPAEAEAVMFLQRLTLHDVDGFGNLSAAARRVVCTLLMDFIAKLMMPGHPLNLKSWRVDASLTQPFQALQVIAAEIGDSHPHLTVKH